MSDPQSNIFVTPFGAGRGRGFMHPSSLRFESPVQGGGVVLGNQCTPGRPFPSTDVIPPPNSDANPHALASQGTHSPVPAPTPNVIAASIVGQMGDALVQQVSQRVAQDIISHLSPSVTTPLLSAAPSPAQAGMLASSPLHSATPRPNHANVSARNAIDVFHLQYIPHWKLKEPPASEETTLTLFPYRSGRNSLGVSLRVGICNLRNKQRRSSFISVAKPRMLSGLGIGRVILTSPTTPTRFMVSCGSTLILLCVHHSH